MKLRKNDPDFFEIFNSFNNREILEYVSISKRTRFIITLATLIANTSKEKYAIAVRDALEVMSPIEIKEVLYQSVAYVGIGKTFELFEVTNDVLAKNGVELPLKSISTVNKENRHEKGLEIQKRYFGDEVIQSMIDNAPEGQERFNDFLSGYCFGDFYTRDALDDKDREMITFCVLATLGGCENQLRAHVAANLNVGNDKEVLIDALTILLPYIGFPRTLNALAIINEY
ncbi:carboxymuconolactone decarboxylase family protein [Methanobrevibacter millerae]|uniref:carboxymuconolactone decarboxylase family protein n=1 Tax=Methanobrevibacter millerae TaxID=230361 RepID=UPI00165ECA7F|nr:carboxymuconolactone decarboxylase family protein [Methanobrevibacter millerae]